MRANRRFLADRMLNRLTRWLRVAGEDVECSAARRDRGADDRDLLTAARATGRVVLTRCRRFPGEPEERHLLLATDLDDQLLEFYQAFPGDPLARAWSRCTVCNAPVEAVERDEIVDLLPPRVRTHGRDFRRCSDCGHLFWAGSHTAHIRARLVRLRQRLLPEHAGPAVPEHTGPAAPEHAGQAVPEHAGQAVPEHTGQAVPEYTSPAALEHAGAAAPEHFDALLRVLFAQHAFSWRGYRKVRRRLRGPLSARLAALGMTCFSAYLDRLATDGAERRRLNALLSISISRFFRDREDWHHLARVALPALRDAPPGRPPRALCLGCASGEEPYTLRLLWNRWIGMSPALAILAADLRADLLARARRAIYPASSLHSVPPVVRAEAFHSSAAGYRLEREIVDSVSFVRLDFYEDPIPGPVDLLLCRNSVFTYLAPVRLQAVVARLRDAVRPGGYLMVGGAEGGDVPAGFAREGRCLFRRLPPALRPPI